MNENPTEIKKEAEVVNEFEKVRGLLDNENVLVRVKAVQFLGRSNDPRAVKLLIDVIREDREWRVQKAAAEELKRYDNNRAMDPLLLALKHEDKRVRDAAMSAIGKNPWAVDSLINMLGEEERRVKWQAIRGLENIGHKKAVEPLIEMLNDPDANIRAAAIRALVKVGDGDAVRPIVDALKDKNEKVRKFAALGLGKFRDTRTYMPLIGRLGSDEKSAEVRKAAKRALVENNEDIVKLIINELIESHDGIKRNNLKDILRTQFRQFLKFNDALVKSRTQEKVKLEKVKTEKVKTEKVKLEKVKLENAKFDQDKKVSGEEKKPELGGLKKGVDISEKVDKVQKEVSGPVKEELKVKPDVNEQPIPPKAISPLEVTEKVKSTPEGPVAVKKKVEKVKKIAVIKTKTDDDKLVEGLERLTALKKNGALDEEEFKMAKKALLEK